MADAAQLGVGALAPVGDSVKRRMLTPVLSNSGAFIASEIMRALSRNRKINPGYHAAAGALGALSGRLALRGIDALQADPGGALS